MKKILSSLLLFAAALGVTAQTDPVLMTVGHFKVTRGEFEYAYNKNSGEQGAVEEKTPEEYAEMYLNYKLKVLAAEDAGLDTLGALQAEYRTYRDAQLTPYLVYQQFIDSVARSLYDDVAGRLQGKDILTLSHILLLVPADATEGQRAVIKQRADSVYNALRAGADFAQLAMQVSQDPGSARYGGMLRPVGPGELVKEFEDAAYKLNKGDISQPVLTAYGYHIIQMRDRQPLQPFEELYPTIVNNLKRQGIEEASAEHRIERLVAQSGGRLTREAILDSVLNAHLGDTTSLRYLVQEYREGLLFFEASQNQVWKPAVADEAGLRRHFEANRAQYAWDAPRFRGYIVQAKSKKIFKRALSFVKKNAGADNLSQLVDAEFNRDGQQVRVSKFLVARQGENATIDRLVFGGSGQPLAAFPYEKVVGKTYKQPTGYEDVLQQVVGDYQRVLEDQWVEQLRQRYPHHINPDVLRTVNNHD
ncbi:MAG: peptidylprolyl isomerase [Bacteroidaceae bacterium]|nr:peptidylprolyl isomerase [Bacteroidaceae bacterium]